MEPEKAFCPNCGGEATKIGNEITCVKCDAIFTFNKKGEPKVKQIGIAERLETVEDAVRKIQLNQNLQDGDDHQPPPAVESEDEGPDAEED